MLAAAVGPGLFQNLSSLFTPGLEADFGWSRGQISTAAGLALIAAAVAPLVGRVADRVWLRPVIVVTMLLIPYCCFASPLAAIFFCLFNAGLVILIFTFYVSVVRKEPFKPAFFEMIAISFGVAALSFCIDWAARTLLGIEM